VGLLAEHPPFPRFLNRLYRVLSGHGDDFRIEAAMLAGAISTAVMHPLIADIDDDTLRAKLIDLSRRLVNLNL
jgi:hypothetical protein